MERVGTSGGGSRVTRTGGVEGTAGGAGAVIPETLLTRTTHVPLARAKCQASRALRSVHEALGPSARGALDGEWTGRDRAGRGGAATRLSRMS